MFLTGFDDIFVILFEVTGLDQCGSYIKNLNLRESEREGGERDGKEVGDEEGEKMKYNGRERERMRKRERITITMRLCLSFN
jgi:hypothetical protein